MAFSIYDASVPVFIRGLKNLASLLEKGRADAEARKFAPEVLLGARLAPDMFNLCRQVQVAGDMAKNGIARLAGLEIPTFADTETSFEDLQARISKTIGFLESVHAEQVEGAETREIVLKLPGREMRFTGAGYLTQFVLPNFYFHLATAYNIMRHNGVPIGKRDFLGG